ncbi:MAG: ATP-binding cassette domain-containing protein [Pseudomonadota bacterium]
MGFKIELKNVSFAYDKGANILNEVNLVVHPGEVVALSVPVGGGKSTFLKVCAGILEPTSGELIIDEKNFWQLNTIDQNYLRSCMGFDFQEAALISNMTIFGNLALSLRYQAEIPEPKIQTTVSKWLADLQLTAYQDQLPAALSLGLRRRVSFIRAMLSGGNFFFWDDPSEGRTVEFEQIIIKTILEKKKNGISSLITSQDKIFVEQVVDRVLCLEQGHLHS